MMKRNIIFRTGFYLAILGIIWLTVNYLVLFNIQQQMVKQVSIEEIEKQAPVIYLGLLYLMIFHVYSLGSLVLQIKYFKTGHKYGYLLLITGSISLIFFLADAALLSDIGKEYMIWDVTGEFIALYTVDLLHGVFVMGMLFFYLYSSRISKNKEIQIKTERDDAAFISTNVVGLICGLVGLAVIIMEFLGSRPVEITRIIILWNLIFILAPYAIMVLIWLIVKTFERPIKLYDEKQFSDISRASFYTLLLSIVIIISGYFLSYISKPDAFFILWIPLTLFFMLSLFSGFTLFYFRYN